MTRRGKYYRGGKTDGRWWRHHKDDPAYAYRQTEPSPAQIASYLANGMKDLIPVLYVRDLDWYVSIEDFWGKYEPGFPRPYLVSRTGWVTRRTKWMPKKDITHRLYKRGVGMYGITSLE